jgi:hypothetical protein
MVDKTGADELKEGFWKMADDRLLSEPGVLELVVACVGVVGVGGSGRSFRSLTSLAFPRKDMDIRDDEESNVRGGREGRMGPDSGVCPWLEHEPCRCSPSM